MEKIYFDNNGTTKTDPRVIAAMVEEMERGPSNPSSLHSFGRAAKARLTLARESIAAQLGIAPDEIIFTSSGTEALNLALLGQKERGPLISSAMEHSAVYETLKRLDSPITYLTPSPDGQLSPKDLEEAIIPSTRLIVLSGANSETGVKLPLEEFAKIAEEKKIPFVVDGVQLLGKEPFSIPKGVTAMAFSGHKFHGPKGMGLLFCRKKHPLSPLITGGGQEKTLRSGTENMPGIVGFAKAIELLQTELPEANMRMAMLRDRLEEGVQKIYPSTKVNGVGNRLCNTSNLFFEGVDGEGLLIQLDMQGIAVSMGSACSSGSHEPSRVLLQMGRSRSEAMSSLRFSLSRFTTSEEIDEALLRIRSLLS